MKTKIKQDCERKYLRGCRGCPAIGICSKIAKEDKNAS